ncbi:MAG: ComF family protein [Candidatus Bipolaricaulota bacterium]|nr:MAG: ComF family protein [Candidatus Bipolaricaulota bacterium]
MALLYTPRCALCERRLDDLRLVCPTCDAELPGLDSPRCVRCEAPLESSFLDLCVPCGTTLESFVTARALGPYEGSWGALVRLLKFGQERAVARFLARRMAILARESSWAERIETITYVPMTRTERRQRGWNQARVLARQLGRALHRPTARLLVKQRTTRRQTGLSAGERRENLRDAFRSVGSAGGGALLVDAIYTTGATADACARALRCGGWREVYVLTAARAHGGPR